MSPEGKLVFIRRPAGRLGDETQDLPAAFEVPSLSVDPRGGAGEGEPGSDPGRMLTYWAKRSEWGEL